jgi:predicted nucleic acid-binding protein
VSLVLDASVTMSWLLGDANDAVRDYSQSVLLAMTRPGVQADVPVIWALEVANVIARAEARGLVTEAQSGAFLEMLSEAPIAADAGTYSAALSDTLHLARRYRLSAYDAAYLELALRAGLPLATLDAELLAAARAAGVKRFE